MGDPKFSRRKYDTPSHPWQGERIKEEHELLKKYGLKNKRELWKAQSLLRNLRGQGRDILARLRYGDVQAEKEMKGLLKKLANLGLLPEDAALDDVLALDIERILERRLQTLVYLKGLAYTQKQARQLIIHGHTVVNARKVTVPGYLVKKNEEPSISYNPYSPLANDLHPTRPTAEHIERIARKVTMPEGKVGEQKGEEKKAADEGRKAKKKFTVEKGKEAKKVKAGAEEKPEKKTPANKSEKGGET